MIPSNQRTERLFTVFALVSLLALQLKVVWGGWASWDLPLADGAAYYAATNNLLWYGAFPQFEWSPFYVIYYALFNALFESSLWAYTTHRIVTLMLGTSLLFLLLRRFTPVLIAWGVAAYMVLIGQNMHNGFVVHAFMLVPIYLTLLLATFNRWYTSLLVLTGLAIIAYSRPEFGIVTMLSLVFMLVYDWRTGVWKQLDGAKRYIYGGGLVLILVVFGWILRTTANAERGFDAFEILYAVGYVERNPGAYTGPNIYYDWEPYYMATFGDASSLLEAFRADPGEFNLHLIGNLRLLPSQLRVILQPTGPLEAGFWGLLAVVVVLVGVVLFRRDATRPNVFRQAPRMWGLLAILALPTLAIIVILRPRPIYLLALQPLLLLLLGVTAAAAFHGVLGQRTSWSIPVLGLVLLLLYPMPYNIDVGRAVVEAVEAMDPFVEPDEPFGLIGDEAYAFCHYAGMQNCVPYSPRDLPAYDAVYPEDFINANNVQIVILGDAFAQKLTEALNGYYTTLGLDPRRFGWDRFADAGYYGIYTPIEQLELSRENTQ
jgi:hypothetical protein